MGKKLDNAIEKIGKYEISEEIGRGSMGTVYSARDPFMDFKVAIKVAHTRHIDESERGKRFRKLFFNEVHAAGLLDHPSIIRVYDADMAGDVCYIVMEYVPGAKTLGPFCKSDSLLSLQEVVGIIYKLAKALDYAHRQGVIHRDIKPTNILYTEDGDIKLADFSIAMINRKDFDVTQFDGFLGSPIYMSPEQINEDTLTSSTDIFSLGTVMYQLLTGFHPFIAENLHAVCKKINEDKPPPLSEFRNDTSKDLQYILRRMLKKMPEKRYRTGLDLAADLAVLYEDLDNIDDEESLKKKFATIKNLGFFKGFNDDDIWELIRACNWERYPPEKIIVREGELDHSFYIVLSGVVKIEKDGQHLDNLQEGDCFGEMGYLAKTERTATVIAKTVVSLVKINAKTLDRADEATQLRFLKVFVSTVITRLADTTSAYALFKQVHQIDDKDKHYFP